MNTKTKTKVLTLALCALLLAAATALTSLAFLKSYDAVNNTFTVGKVAITLDEAKEQKIYEIKKYANSCDLKTFFLNEVATWIEVDQRYQAMMTINSAKNRIFKNPLHSVAISDIIWYHTRVINMKHDI